MIKLKTIISAVLISGALLTSCSSSDGDGNGPQPQLKTTFMVYIEGADLESDGGAASENIKQMLAAKSSDTLNVVIQTGASNINYDEPSSVPPENETQNPPVRNWLNVKRHEIKNGSIIEKADLGRGCDPQAEISSGCVDMGKPEALSDFINYSVDNYPADRYILVLWDHGGGSVGGYGGGTASNMNINDIMEALRNSAGAKNIKLEILGFDACLMANTEFAYNLEKYARYLVASEELEPGEGWGYTAPLEAIAENPSISGAEIGKKIADAFIENNLSSQDNTLSVTDTSRVRQAVEALDSLSQTAMSDFNADKTKTWINIFSARNDTDEFGKMPPDYFVNNADLSDFASALKYYGGESYESAADAVIKAVESSVVYNRTGVMHKSAKGLSFYMPFHFSDPFNGTLMTAAYKNIFYSQSAASFSENYILLLDALMEHAVSTPSEFELEDKPSVTGEAMSLNVISNFGIDDAILLIDGDAQTAGIQPLVSNVAKAEQNPSEAVSFSVKANLDEKALAIGYEGYENPFPAYMIFDGKAEADSKTYHQFKIPLFYKESASEDPETAVLYIAYNFDGDSYIVDDAVRTDDFQGRNEVPLEEGDILIIPDVTIDENGEVAITPSDKEIIIGAKLSEGLSVTKTDVPGKGDYALYITNLKGEPRQSGFFNISGNASINAKYAADSINGDAIAKALSKPFWSNLKK